MRWLGVIRTSWGLLGKVDPTVDPATALGSYVLDVPPAAAVPPRVLMVITVDRAPLPQEGPFHLRRFVGRSADWWEPEAGCTYLWSLQVVSDP